MTKTIRTYRRYYIDFGDAQWTYYDRFSDALKQAKGCSRKWSIVGETYEVALETGSKSDEMCIANIARGGRQPISTRIEEVK